MRARAFLGAIRNDATSWIQSSSCVRNPYTAAKSPPNNVHSPVDQLATQPDPALGRQRHRESSARTYARRLALNLVAARGVYVRDSRGNEYLDCLAGAGALALGHAHPAI